MSSFNALLENKEKFLKIWKAEDGNELRKYTAKEFIGIIEDGIEIDEFDLDLYFKMIEKIIIFKDDKIVVRFLDGTEVEFIIE